MEKAKVFIAEDEAQWRSQIQDILEDDGHVVVGQAATKQDALSAVSKFAELGVEVATLDRNLDPANINGKDGDEILAAIRAGAPHVKTIGVSDGSFPGVDIDLGKSGVGSIGEVVNKL